MNLVAHLDMFDNLEEKIGRKLVELHLNQDISGKDKLMLWCCSRKLLRYFFRGLLSSSGLWIDILLEDHHVEKGKDPFASI